MAVRKRAAKKTTAAVKPVVEKVAEAPAAKAEEKAVAVKPAEKAEEKAVAVKPAEKAEEKAATVKAAEKPAAEKKTARKAPVKKEPVKKEPAKKAELKSSICVQFGGKSYSQDDLIKIARDVWKYDLKQKVGSLESVELYVKPEENMVYYVMNKEFTGSFYI